MKRFHYTLLICCLFLICTMTVALSQERHRLYTKTNPEDTGGIKGVFDAPSKPIEQILAIPPDEPRYVYQGKVTGDKKRGFLFESLPMDTYDLVVVYSKEFYEGLELHPKPNTLTSEDLKKITETITDPVSEPYFLKKIIHRVEGTTGQGNVARCICTYFRDKASSSLASHRAGLEFNMEGAHGPDWRQTFKLIWMKDVGPGWQVVQKRDLYPIWIPEGSPLPKHHFSGKLSRIRVTDSIKDLGTISMDSAKDKSAEKP